MHSFTKLRVSLVGMFWLSSLALGFSQDIRGVVTRNIAGDIAIRRQDGTATALPGLDPRAKYVLEELAGRPIQLPSLSVQNPAAMETWFGQARLPAPAPPSLPIPSSLAPAQRAKAESLRKEFLAIGSSANNQVNKHFSNLTKIAIATGGEATSNQLKLAMDTFKASVDSTAEAGQQSAQEICQREIEQGKTNEMIGYLMGLVRENTGERDQKSDMSTRVRVSGRALYGKNDGYPLCVYERIVKLADSAVSLKRGGRRFCSGFLVTKDLVMTAAHCLTRTEGGSPDGPKSYLDAAELAGVKVQINGFARPGPRMREVAIAEVILPASPDATAQQRIGDMNFASDLLDVALLRLAPNDAEIRPARLCNEAAAEEMGEPYVLFGHPGGGRGQILDNARGILPYRVSSAVKREVLCKLAAPIWNAASQVSQPAAQSEVMRIAGRIMKAIMDTYVDNGAGSFTLRHRGYSPSGMPAFILDPDAESGASGGMVVHRRQLCVAGIFSAGVDSKQVSHANWFVHEIAVPTSEILSQLKALKAAGGAVGKAYDDIEEARARLEEDNKKDICEND
ncbi:MAG: trypsin-like peptidase domain-containing protein [Bosea sp.]|uniref:trypsin-like serine peptidase n=1 Tax=Bosea sp. (in: a-proteobacteria) TaxID=1871050 RepID=UPI001AD1A07C|nr:serine protease [Bosea sp. (in: a-proteobacteria)]MBN9451752.1 trypsin-like peptidase domain-containing protein [Bosea sp. (in: a-proteobacteria)]